MKKLSKNQIDARDNSASPGNSTLFDPFALGAPATVDGKEAPPAKPATRPAPAPRKAAAGFSTQLRDAAADRRPGPIQLARAPLVRR